MKPRLSRILVRFLGEPIRRSGDGERREDVWKQYGDSALLDVVSVFGRRRMQHFRRGAAKRRLGTVWRIGSFGVRIGFWADPRMTVQVGSGVKTPGHGVEAGLFWIPLRFLSGATCNNVDGGRGKGGRRQYEGSGLLDSKWVFERSRAQQCQWGAEKRRRETA